MKNNPTDSDIEIEATKQTSFPIMCYPDENMERQCKKKFIEGAKWALSIDIENQFDDNDMIEFSNWCRQFNGVVIDDAALQQWQALQKAQRENPYHFVSLT